MDTDTLSLAVAVLDDYTLLQRDGAVDSAGRYRTSDVEGAAEALNDLILQIKEERRLLAGLKYSLNQVMKNPADMQSMLALKRSIEKCEAIWKRL